MKKLLRKLKIVQTVNNDERYKQGLKRMGQGYSKANRLNPNNPLSYLALIGGVFVVFFYEGFKAIKEQIFEQNPFKWN